MDDLLENSRNSRRTSAAATADTNISSASVFNSVYAQTELANELLQPRLLAMIPFFESASNWIETNQSLIQNNTREGEASKIAELKERIDNVVQELRSPLPAPSDDLLTEGVNYSLMRTVQTLCLYAAFRTKDDRFDNPSMKLDSTIPVITLPSIVSAADRFHQNVSSTDFNTMVNPERIRDLLITAALGLRVPVLVENVPKYGETNPLSLAIAIANSHQKKIYVKAHLISAIKEAGVLVCENDRDLVKESEVFDMDSGNISGDFRYNFELYAERAAPYIASRINLLENEAIYLKPVSGACGVGVIKVERSENGLILQAESKTLAFLELAALGELGEQHNFAASSRFLKHVYLRDMSNMERAERFLVEFACKIDLRDEPGIPEEFKKEFLVERYVLQNRGSTVMLSETGVYEDQDDYPPDFRSKIIELIKEGKCRCDFDGFGEPEDIGKIPDLFSAVQRVSHSEQHGQGVLKIEIGRKDEAHFLMGLDRAMLACNSMLYAEQAINAPKYLGKGYEVRVINFDDMPAAYYCKVAESEGSVLNNISQDGRSADFDDVLHSIYRDMHPLLDDSEIEKRIALTKSETDKVASQAAIAAQQQINEEVATVLDGYANPKFIERFKQRTCSTDFMFEVAEDPTLGQVLHPVLIDCNMFYGFSGLESVDILLHLEISMRLRSLNIKSPLDMLVE